MLKGTYRLETSRNAFQTFSKYTPAYSSKMKATARHTLKLSPTENI